LGAIGTPVHTLAVVTALNESDLSAMIGRILPITAIIVPFWLVRAMVSWQETFEVFPAILIVGGSFAATQWFWSNYMDSNLVDIAAGVGSMIATLLFLRFWQPKRIWRFADEAAVNAAEARASIKHYSTGQIAKAWMPFAILSVFVLVWGLPAVKLAMNQATTPSFKVVMADGKVRPGPAGWDWPYLHAKVFSNSACSAKAGRRSRTVRFQLAHGHGNGLLLRGPFCGRNSRPQARKNVSNLRPHPLPFAFRDRGHDLHARPGLRHAILRYGCHPGSRLTRTGWLFPFFGTFIGWLGVALTGSDTSSNALFGGLQKITRSSLTSAPF